ncbi:ParA family protein [Clostridium estertheticum]|uniref:ParA family protein n=1 Tax=Clostridium estertheticum TaxID=238834 RepID=UPI001C0B12BB|nr:ParA family protein [Clostridium estertheticum]MBU3174390.1 ParA family protein [Clostridium estertheticum]MBX4267229.1 ParA family protein [Clostridium estertheticum]MBX4272050.1 ParA family protein [Clostridium estertheticum]MCB2309202.1 ParA family protein [Clostridium estertheticum]MCB2347566.1 ParA family protein [Clostridium estertheticum]
MKKDVIVIAIYNNKGGIGKSTFAINLLHSLVTDFKKEDGTPYRCLAIDNDGQSNATLTLTGKSEDEISETTENTMFNLMTDEDVLAKDCVINTKFENIFLIPATDDHSDTPDAISNEMDNTRIMKEKIAPIKSEYDFIVIDCAPTKDRNVYNALFAADIVLSPMETQLFSRVGLRNLLKQVNKVNKKRETPLLHYVFLSKVDNRQKTNNQRVKENLQTVLLDDFIDKGISLLSLYVKSLDEGYTAINYPSDNRGKIEIRDLTQKILEKINEELI